MTLDHAARLDAFASALARYATRVPPLVMLVPEYSPETVAFFREYPDRLLCGRDAFEALRAQGLAEVPAVARAVGA